MFRPYVPYEYVVILIQALENIPNNEYMWLLFQIPPILDDHWLSECEDFARYQMAIYILHKCKAYLGGLIYNDPTQMITRTLLNYIHYIET